MSSEKNTSSNKLCPTCGTRLSENATRCPVCGRAITATATPKRESDLSVQGPRMPPVSLNLPLAIAMFIIVDWDWGWGVSAFARSTPQIVVDFTATLTSPYLDSYLDRYCNIHRHPVPTATPLPPKEYVVKSNDTCVSIAYLYNVSINSIVLLNNLTGRLWSVERWAKS